MFPANYSPGTPIAISVNSSVSSISTHQISRPVQVFQEGIKASQIQMESQVSQLV